MRLVVEETSRGCRGIEPTSVMQGAYEVSRIQFLCNASARATLNHWHGACQVVHFATEEQVQECAEGASTTTATETYQAQHCRLVLIGCDCSMAARAVVIVEQLAHERQRRRQPEPRAGEERERARRRVQRAVWCLDRQHVGDGSEH